MKPLKRRKTLTSTSTCITYPLISLNFSTSLYIFQELQPKPIIYIRYIDDVGATTNSFENAQKMLKYMNTKHLTIQFELEIPDTEGFLPILDEKIRIKEDRYIKWKLYVKKTNRGILRHFHSHRPSSIKCTSVLNEFRIANTLTTPKHRAWAIKSTIAKLQPNGYSEEWQDNVQQEQQSKRRKKNTHQDCQI